jgi:hypothetical protein
VGRAPTAVQCLNVLKCSFDNAEPDAETRVCQTEPSSLQESTPLLSFFRLKYFSHSQSLLLMLKGTVSRDGFGF